MKKVTLEILIFLGLVSIIILLVSKCNNSIIHDNNFNRIDSLSADSDSLKKVIRKQEIEKDSLISLANRKDSVRVEYVTRWRSVKANILDKPCDSILPEVVNICDSIIYVDSSEIAIQKQALIKSDSIISEYKNVVKNDSTIIFEQKGEIRRQKRQKRIAIGAAIIGFGAAIFK